MTSRHRARRGSPTLRCRARSRAVEPHLRRVDRHAARRHIAEFADAALSTAIEADGGAASRADLRIDAKSLAVLG